MLSLRTIPTPSVNIKLVETLSADQATQTLTVVILLSSAFQWPTLKPSFIDDLYRIVRKLRMRYIKIWSARLVVFSSPHGKFGPNMASANNE